MFFVAYRNWMNSIGVSPYVSHLYKDLSNGLVLLQVKGNRLIKLVVFIWVVCPTDQVIDLMVVLMDGWMNGRTNGWVAGKKHLMIDIDW